MSLDGHYFFIRGTMIWWRRRRRREAVREVVRSITDHLMRNDFKLIDHDGTPTRWGSMIRTFEPDAHLACGAGLNSLSMLSYLSVAGM